MPSVREMLDEHEKIIVAKLKALREQITPLEQELLDVRMAKGALQRDAAAAREPQLALAKPGMLVVADAISKSTAAPVIPTTDATRSPYFRFTYKELVLKALMEHFPNGATANQMLDLFANVWGRGDIMRTSLSPQLSRLKDENRIFREGHVWHLRRPRQTEKTATDQ
jgi:hypothetical protein